MSHTENTPPPMADFLEAITQAMLVERDQDAHTHAERLGGDKRNEARQLVMLVTRLRDTLIEQTPEEVFRRKLKEDLIGMDYSVITRLRYLPARVQIAAGITLLAGGAMLLTRRRGEAQPAPSSPEAAGITSS